MKATIFITTSYHPLDGAIHRRYMTEIADTAEECLRRLGDRMRQLLNYPPTLTFRPHNGMIFCTEMSSDIPIGVLYRQGYQREQG